VTRRHARLGPGLLLAGLAAATTWSAMNAWRELTVTPGDFLNPLLLLGAVVAVTGAMARWWRWPALAVVGFQAAVSTALAMLLVIGTPLPLGGGWTELTTTISDALETSQKYAAPIQSVVAPVDSLLIFGGLACLLIVDLLACTLRRVPLAGLPLLAVFSVPLGMVDTTISGWVFGATAAGFLALLYLQESEQVARWGRPLAEDRETGDPIAFGAGSHAVRGTASLIGGAATALAVLIPVLVPATGWHLFDFGPGSGDGQQIRVQNPTVDLVRDLKQGKDVDLVHVTTTDPDPSYLRILALTRFTEAEWSPGDRDVPVGNLADGSMPPPSGVSVQVERQQYPYDVSISPLFDSSWLPTQPPVSQVSAEGDWRYDEKTMDFLAGDKDLSAAGLDYSMTAVHLDLDAARLADAGPATGKVDDMFTALPDNLPPIVADLAAEATEGATTEYEKAVALQQWFREDGGFTYSLDTAVEGSGTDALVDFLSPEGRTGYCEQFASAMAVMARELNIPARVAIGFLHPTPDGPNGWTYSSLDMHAWPELYFDGAGWVRFEPTPAERADDVPGYTVPGSGVDEPSVAPSPTESDASTSASVQPRPVEDSGFDADAAAGGGSGVSWIPVACALAVLLLLAVVLLLPRLVRRRRRDRRLASGEPELVWAELADTAVDLGSGWPRGRSPRATRDWLVDLLGAPVGPHTPERPPRGPAIAPEAVGALDRIVRTLELQRYARGGVQVDPVRLRADGEAVLDALAGGAARNARRRATWWPRSVLSLRRERRSGGGPADARYGGVVDQVS
jgi:transglutaminase-like putative cysteine protease